MMYEIGMLCKHFKGENLLEKNIYKIIKLGVNGKELDTSVIEYTGDGILNEAVDLVVYQNVFQDNKFFAREYSDISSELSLEKQNVFHQKYKVEPLNEDELDTVLSSDFVAKKYEFEKNKHNVLKK